MTNNKKIQVIYPDGRCDCQDIVADTFRSAIKYIGLEKVRALGIKRNSINIVSTKDEMELSTGKHIEEHSIKKLSDDGELGICTEFSTQDKYRYLVHINEVLNAGLHISLIDDDKKDTSVFIPEEETTEEIKEGLLKEYNTTRYERSHIARRLCLHHYGDHIACQVCGFDFEKAYGPRENAEPFIEIHHIDPLAETSSKNGEHKVDYVNDLIPVCANCHRMLHNLRKRTLLPSELKRIIDEHKTNLQ